VTIAAPRLLLGLAMGAAASIIWGGHAVVARQALTGQGFHLLDILACRYAPAALILAPIAWKARGSLLALGWWRIGLLTLTGGAVNLAVFAGALAFAPASHGATIPPMTVPIIGALMAWWWLAERPTRDRLACLALMAAGVAIIGWDGLGTGPGVWIGDLLLLAAGATWAAFTVLLRRWKVAAVPAAAAVTILSALLVIPFWLPLRAAAFLALPPGLALWMVVAQGVLLGAISMLLFARAVELLGATRTSTLSVLVPIVGLLAAWWVLGEAIGPVKVAGAALALGAMLVAVLFTGRRPGAAAR
jgi:drug/metabolite transporter (DMT)-like permease